jgi:hypothetical protein
MIPIREVPLASIRCYPEYCDGSLAEFLQNTLAELKFYGDLKLMVQL